MVNRDSEPEATPTEFPYTLAAEATVHVAATPAQGYRFENQVFEGISGYFRDRLRVFQGRRGC